MGKYLDKAGLQRFWGKVKNYVSSAVSTLKGTVDAYTVNGKKVSMNPVLGAGDVGAVPTTEKGAAGGVATLGSDGKVPQAQLPTLDLSLYKVVESLPTEGIDANKIYLVAGTSTGTQNIYKEYIYTGDTGSAYDAGKWEELGEYKAAVDLTPYAKKSEAAGTAELIQKSSMTDSRIKLLYLKTTHTDGTADEENAFPEASDQNNGLMSAEDKEKIDGIATGATADSALTTEEIDEIVNS